MDFALSFLLGYFFGAFPSGLVLVKWLCGIDIRKYGSGNIGSTNVFRTAGARMASLVLLTDVFKGIFAVLLARFFFGESTGVDLCAAIGAMLGHNYSVFLGFKGGRGVATGLGLLLLLMPDVCIFTVTVWLVLVYLTQYVSLASIAAALITPIVALLRHYPLPLVAFAAAAALFIIIRHYDNMKRLLAGTETKIKQGKLSDINKK